MTTLNLPKIRPSYIIAGLVFTLSFVGKTYGVETSPEAFLLSFSVGVGLGALWAMGG